MVSLGLAAWLADGSVKTRVVRVTRWSVLGRIVEPGVRYVPGPGVDRSAGISRNRVDDDANVIDPLCETDPQLCMSRMNVGRW